MILQDLRAAKDILILARIEDKQIFITDCLTHIVKQCTTIINAQTPELIVAKRNAFLGQVYTTICELIGAYRGRCEQLHAITFVRARTSSKHSFRSRPTLSINARPWDQFLKGGAPGFPRCFRPLPVENSIQIIQVISMSAVLLRMQWSKESLLLAKMVQDAVGVGNVFDWVGFTDTLEKCRADLL